MSSLSNINPELSMHYLIYKIYNITNGKYYIGQHKTVNPYDYYTGSGTIIRMAIEKYMLSSFIKIFLFDFDNFEEMNNKEKELVQLSNCWPIDKMSYNIRGGGSSSMNPETINKILNTRSEHHISYKGKNNPMYGISPQERMTNEIYNGWVQSLREYEMTEETKQKISKKLKGKKFTAKHKRKISDAECGKPKNLTDEQRKALSERMSKLFKDIPKTEEHKKKIGLGNRGKVRSEECKKHMSEVMTGRKASEEARRKMSLAHKGHKFSKEHNEKISRNNCMHGHSVMDYMTKDKIITWKQHIAKASRGRRKMYNPVIDKIVFVKQDKFQKYLDLGYHFGSRPRKPKNA